MVLLWTFPKLWVFGKDTDVSDGKYELPLDYDIGLWRKAMACFHCVNRNCKRKRNRKLLHKTSARFVPLLFAIHFFQCGKKWRGACEKFFNRCFDFTKWGGQ